MTVTDVALRIGIAASLIVSGVSHAYLYVHGYRHIPTIGDAFVLQASVSLAVAALIMAGGPAWLRWVAVGVAGGALVAFVLSRTVGVLGFTEKGWEPAPHAVLSAVAEALTILLWAVSLATRRRAAPG